MTFLQEASRDVMALCHRRDAIADADMTPDQLAEAQRLAREWTAKHGK